MEVCVGEATAHLRVDVGTTPAGTNLRGRSDPDERCDVVFGDRSESCPSPGDHHPDVDRLTQGVRVHRSKFTIPANPDLPGHQAQTS